MKLLAKTMYGLEEVLAKELRQLGADDVQTHKRAVSFWGNQAMMYKANLHLRTALRILLPIHQFTARNESALYRGVQAINWEKYLKTRDTLAVDCALSSSFFNHSHYLSLKTKDAIVDQFRKKFGKRPSVDPISPDLRINIHITRDQCTISLDSSGDSLHKRGYRLEKNPAPLNEVLAAGMIQLSGWEGGSHFVDPMCGSGTLPMEAAMIALNIAPGLNRKFGFMNWPDFDRNLWRKTHRRAEHVVTPSIAHKIIGSDISGSFINIARENLRRAKVVRVVNLYEEAIEDFIPPTGKGIAIINPPYGERLQVEDIEALYESIGDQLKQKYAGYDAWILSANTAALKRIGLRASKKMELFNGPLACRFYKYEMYKGKAV